MRFGRREILSGGTALMAGAALGGTTTAAASASPAAKDAPAFDVMPFVHPELRAAVAKMGAMAAVTITPAMLPMARSTMSGTAPKPEAAPAIRELTIPGPRDNPSLRIYVINEGDKGKPRAAILNMHGGGFILGRAADELPALQKTARELDCVIVTVEYRLAPETPFPGSLEDSYAALRWLHANAPSLGADPGGITVMGASAGGGLAAMLAIAARDRGEVPIVFQALHFPMLDDRTGSTVQRPRQQGAVMWTPASNRFGWTALLGAPAGSDAAPRGAVPARESDLAGLPPTVIGVGSIDLFYEENVEYARRLAAAGVPVEMAIAPGAYHGFVMVEDAPVTQRYLQHFNAALARGLTA